MNSDATRRLLVARAPTAQPVKSIEHIEVENKWTTSYERAVFFAEQHEHIQIVQGWLVHPYMRHDRYNGQTIIEPYYWNYDVSQDKHISISPQLNEDVTFVLDRWDLFDPLHNTVYPYPPVIHLIQIETGVVWAFRQSDNSLLTTPDITDASIIEELIKDTSRILLA